MDAMLVENMRDIMAPKSTDELVQIWVENDRTKYVEEAFEAIHQILEERGEEIPSQLPPRKERPIRKEQEIQRERGGYFSFFTLISPTMIKIIYFLGMTGLTIGGIVMIKIGLDVGGWGAEKLNIFGNQISYNKQILIGVGLIILGNLVWRLFCEAWILLFGMHDILRSIERHLSRERGML